MTSRDSPLAKFGPFVAVFENNGDGGVGSYLDLLTLYWDRSATVIERIASIMEKADCGDYVRVLFDDPNWRPHIVAAIACLINQGTAALDNLWEAVDVGSWVTPQLCITAYFIDPQFPERARSRLDARCPVSPPEGLTPAERHSATGPAGVSQRSAKTLASLLELCEHIPATATWSRELRQESDIAEMLRLDQQCDNSARITADWFDRASRRFANRGTPLKPAFAGLHGEMK